MMCVPSWPSQIGREAFIAYATEVHGWKSERAAIAWKWAVGRQAQINAEKAEKDRLTQEARKESGSYV